MQKTSTNTQLKLAQAIKILDRYLGGLESLKKTEKILIENNTPLKFLERGKAKMRVMFKINGRNVIVKL